MSQVTLLLVFGVFHVMSEVPANLLANVLATVPSYALNRRWVWGKSGKSHFWREVAPFWILSFVGLAFSSLAVWLAGDFARAHGLSHGATALLVNLANLLSFAILWIVKFVIYNKLFHVEPVEYEEHHAEKVAAGEVGGDQDVTGPRGSGPTDGGRQGCQSRKLLNCSGMPKSSALHLAMTSWRSSRFLPVTRS